MQEDDILAYLPPDQMAEDMIEPEKGPHIFSLWRYGVGIISGVSLSIVLWSVLLWGASGRLSPEMRHLQELKLNVAQTLKLVDETAKSEAHLAAPPVSQTFFPIAQADSKSQISSENNNLDSQIEKAPKEEISDEVQVDDVRKRRWILAGFEAVERNLSPARLTSASAQSVHKAALPSLLPPKNYFQWLQQQLVARDVVILLLSGHDLLPTKTQSQEGIAYQLALDSPKIEWGLFPERQFWREMTKASQFWLRPTPHLLWQVYQGNDLIHLPKIWHISAIENSGSLKIKGRTQNMSPILTLQGSEDLGQAIPQRVILNDRDLAPLEAFLAWCRQQNITALIGSAPVETAGEQAEFMFRKNFIRLVRRHRSQIMIWQSTLEKSENSVQSEGAESAESAESIANTPQQQPQTTPKKSVESNLEIALQAAVSYALGRLEAGSTGSPEAAKSPSAGIQKSGQ